eukprot:Protomagalhaensia_sp_Gyna_25__3807@NODE_341_length_3814_cov_136_672848_g267_i0_p1_GENE_NODE_341_length_3814_cov_136_672848_g267_i0NODE_341_length_3814_cov_136_672848_g267_i0_p1_ORF_typecomplete_len489_score70_58AidB_N/PF18158_1/0_031_NODE_341_length_3814_cov_136_672848_g267_i07962262
MRPPACHAQVLTDIHHAVGEPEEDIADTHLLITRRTKETATDDADDVDFTPPQTTTSEDRGVWVDDVVGPARMAANEAAAQKSQYVVEAWNDSRLRGVRITQRELSVIGTNKVVTKVEVVERDPDDPGLEPTVAFSVKHTHNVNWRRQLSIHKNLLLACILAGVDCPIEIPEDSVKVFKSIENPQHVHIYLERVIPHFRFRTLPPQVSAFWWRAVWQGTLVFQNWATGRVVALPCKQKGVPAAAETLKKALVLLNNMPPQFFEVDPDYAQINLAADEEAAARDHQSLSSLEHVAEAVQSWALEDGVSPWMTKLIVKCRGPRKGQILQYRYSIGVDVAPAPNASSRPYLSQQGGTLAEASAAVEEWEMSTMLAQIYVAIQVHCNEPLSRELKAYPVCMLPIAVEDFSFREVTALYLRSLWFLRKLFEYHQTAAESDLVSTPARPTGSSSNQPGFLRDIRANDDKDLNARNRLAGGARLTHPKYRGGRSC